MTDSPYSKGPDRPVIKHDDGRGTFIAWNWDHTRWDEVSEDLWRALINSSTLDYDIEPEMPVKNPDQQREPDSNGSRG